MAKRRKKKRLPYGAITFGLCAVLVIAGFLYFGGGLFSIQYERASAKAKDAVTLAAPKPPELDTKDYDKKMLALANYASTSATSSVVVTKVGTTTIKTVKPIVRQWPVKGLPYPGVGAILPWKRIVAYYGNFYSKGMGVLGQYPEDEMIQRLKAEVASWNAADPDTPAIPAIDYIAVTAQGSPQPDGMYRLRMPDSQIDHAVELAKKVNGIVILDVQVGLSNVRTEVPLLEKYLRMPQVHLALDPEFSMKTGAKPGSVIGTMDASDINWAAAYLATLVKDTHLPPKVLIVHRFTENMVTNYKSIKPLPEVQMVLDMDGWGGPARKLNTYTQFVAADPIQFTGFKLFYKNDLKETPARMLTPRELLNLTPRPVFIQYQ